MSLHIQGCFATCGTLTETLPTVLGCRASGGTCAEPLPVGLHIPYSSPLELLVVVLHNCMAGRCCLYRAMLRAEVPRSLVN